MVIYLATFLILFNSKTWYIVFLLVFFVNQNDLTHGYFVILGNDYAS